MFHALMERDNKLYCQQHSTILSHDRQPKRGFIAGGEDVALLVASLVAIGGVPLPACL